MDLGEKSQQEKSVLSDLEMGTASLFWMMRKAMQLKDDGHISQNQLKTYADLIEQARDAEGEQKGYLFRVAKIQLTGWI